MNSRAQYAESTLTIPTGAKIEESSNLSPRAPNILNCVGNWFYAKLNSVISHAITRTTP